MLLSTYICRCISKDYPNISMKIKILIADQSKLFRELLAMQLATTSDLEVVAEASKGAEILDKVMLTNTDIVLTEVFAPDLNGAEVARALQVTHPNIKVVALTSNEEKSVLEEMLESNAWGFFLKNIDFAQLCDNLRCIHKGNRKICQEAQNMLIEAYFEKKNDKISTLTKREKEVLLMLAEGKSIKQISDVLFVSIKTTCTHKQHIFEKLGFENLAQLVRYAHKRGLVT